MNVIRALDDDALFGPHFRGETWGAWRTFLKAWSGLGAEMTEAEAALFRQYTGRTALPDRPFDETTVIAGVPAPTAGAGCYGTTTGATTAATTPRRWCGRRRAGR